MSNKTTPVRTQPSVFSSAVQEKREWKSGLCDCCVDISSCTFSFFCNPCYSCWLSSRAEENCCLPVCLPFGWLVAIRAKIRAEERIQGSILKDCCAATFCGLCTMCQLKRELDYLDNNPVMDLKTI